MLILIYDFLIPCKLFNLAFKNKDKTINQEVLKSSTFKRKPKTQRKVTIYTILEQYNY